MQKGERARRDMAAEEIERRRESAERAAAAKNAVSNEERKYAQDNFL